MIHVLAIHTTGLDPQTDELTELALAAPGASVDAPVNTWRFIPRGPVAPQAARVNGYNEALWRSTGAEVFTHAKAVEIASAAGNAGELLTYWDAVPFVKKAFADVRHPWPRVRVYDLQSLAMPLVAIGALKDTSFRSLCEFFGTALGTRSALSDAVAAAEVFRQLIDGFSRELAGVLNGEAAQ